MADNGNNEKPVGEFKGPKAAPPGMKRRYQQRKAQWSSAAHTMLRRRMTDTQESFSVARDALEKAGKIKIEDGEWVVN